MELLMTQNFNGVNFNCYRAENESDEFFATREQIGQLLEYDSPRISIANIHNRNKSRLDKFSRVIKMITHEENRTVTRDVTVYSFRGLLEICRHSNQPKANAVMDFLYDIADEIRQRGFYATPATAEKILNDPDTFIKILQEVKTLRDTNKKLVAERDYFVERSNKFDEQIAIDRPKVLFAEAVETSKESILIGNFAKILKQNGITIGQNRLFIWFRENGYLMNCKGERKNMPTQLSMEKELFEVKTMVVHNPNGSTKITHTTKITPKGQIYFTDLFLNKGTEARNVAV